MESALELFRRGTRPGATPKGQCRPVRPHDSWRAPDAIPDREALVMNLGGPVESEVLWGRVGAIQEVDIAWRHPKGSSLEKESMATLGMLDGLWATTNGPGWQG